MKTHAPGHFFLLLSISFIVLLIPYGLRADTFTIATFKVGNTLEATQIIRTLYESLGHQINIQELPGRRALIDSNDGKYDGELVRIGGTEHQYPNLIPIPTPIMQSKTVVITLPDSSVSPSSWKELQGYRVAIPSGVQLLENRVKEYQIEHIKVTNAQSVLRMLEYNRIDLTVMPLTMAKQYPELRQLRIVSPPVETVDLFHYVHEKNRHLIKALDQKLKEIIQKQ